MFTLRTEKIQPFVSTASSREWFGPASQPRVFRTVFPYVVSLRKKTTRTLKHHHKIMALSLHGLASPRVSREYAACGPTSAASALRPTRGQLAAYSRLTRAHSSHSADRSALWTFVACIPSRMKYLYRRCGMNPTRLERRPRFQGRSGGARWSEVDRLQYCKETAVLLAAPAHRTVVLSPCVLGLAHLLRSSGTHSHIAP